MSSGTVLFSTLYIVITVNNIGCEGGQEIGRGLSTNSALTQLNLSSKVVLAWRRQTGCDRDAYVLGSADNPLGSEAAKAIGRGLATNFALRVLDLEGKDVGQRKEIMQCVITLSQQKLQLKQRVGRD